MTTHPITGVVGTAISQQIVTPAGGEPPYVVSTTGSLQPGLQLGADGTVSGTPTQGGTYPLSVTVSDALHQTWTGTVAVVITWTTDGGGTGAGTGAGHEVKPLRVLASHLPRHARVGRHYRGYAGATGGRPTYSWSVVGRLPRGLTLRPTTGKSVSIRGRPHRLGTYHLALKVVDGRGVAVVYRFVLRVAPQAARRHLSPQVRTRRVGFTFSG